MKQITKNGATYLAFENLWQVEGIYQGFSTRLGGVSEGCYKSMNLGQYRGDSPDRVQQNYEIISQAMGFDCKHLVVSNQVHGVEIKTVTKDDTNKGIFYNQQPCDGLITKEPDVVLTTQYADCVPLFFVEKNNKAIGMAHAGWKGTVESIAKWTIEKMADMFGVQPKDLLVGIAPSIKQCCFEVDKDVADIFVKKLPWSVEYIVPKQDKYNINLQAINARIITDCKVPIENIEITEYCTKCNEELFFSHRRDGTNRGAMAAFLGIKS